MEDYILEVYDDFNGSELNSTKWITAWWSGAQPATISSGNLKLSGSGSTYDPESLNPRGADAVISAKEEAPTMHSFAEINASGIYGFEAKVMIPTDAPTSTGVGIVGFKFNPNGTKHSMGIELGHWKMLRICNSSMKTKIRPLEKVVKSLLMTEYLEAGIN